MIDKSRGFTLIEIAIVLVIIGLLLGTACSCTSCWHTFGRFAISFINICK